jgi:Alpha/beta hydrolase of unknown function (DUF900)
MTIFMNLRQQPAGGGIKKPDFFQATAGVANKNDPLAEAAFVTCAGGRDILFATHGFNVKQKEGVNSLGRLEAILALPPTALFVGVLWPGDFWIPVVNYPFEGQDAKQCGRLVADFCNRKLGTARSFSFVSHSLGARVVLEAAENLDRKAQSVCVTAGAVDDNCLTGEYAAALDNAEVISVLASRKDRVLQIAYPVGDPIADLLNLHQSPFRTALGRHGPPKPIGATVPPWQIADDCSYDHGDYLPPSQPNAVFPDPNGKWVKTCSFIRAAFDGTPPTWPNT